MVRAAMAAGSSREAAEGWGRPDDTAAGPEADRERGDRSPPQWAQSGNGTKAADKSGNWTTAVFVLWPEAERARARCIVDQESEWLPGAVGDAGERGIFGIHPIHAWRFEKYGGWDTAFDPMVNALVAREIWGEQGWVPWTSAPGCE